MRWSTERSASDPHIVQCRLASWARADGFRPRCWSWTGPTDGDSSHDAVRDLTRSADSDEGSRTGNFPGGLFEYTKTFEVPEEYRDKCVTLEFEGVYRDAMVYVNREFAAQRPNGYTNFYVRADPYLR